MVHQALLRPEHRSAGHFRTVLLVSAGVVVLIAAALYVFIPSTPKPAWLRIALAGLTGENPHPVKLVRPAELPLSALALLGKKIFFDANLSASGKQSCASCHSPARSYGPANADPVQPGGEHMDATVFRPPPSLAYLYRQASFSIGPEVEDQDLAVDLNQSAQNARGAQRAQKTAGVLPAAPNLVPQGGLFWDGRADTLQAQAIGPLLDSAEMANVNEAAVADKLAHANYAADFIPLFGPNILHAPELLVSEAMSAVSRFQIEDASFHSFDSKYDLWLEGKARLSAAELRGLKVFNNPNGANCAGCHPSAASRDGLPPVFTDTQYEALSAPRNEKLAVNHDPAFYDLGVCGPRRLDLAQQRQYCAMFLTPTLRNSATRSVYFHNAVYTSLKQVMNFYNQRMTHPELVYPHDASGKTLIDNDIPADLRANVDVADAPFDRHQGDTNPMTDQDIEDVIAFLNTLNDGYQANQ
jgi:cytochrome c peroxidase